MARLRSLLLDPRLLDGLLALVLTVALLRRLGPGEDADDTLVNVVGGLFLTLPLAARRRAPLAVTCTFAATAALNAILGGDLFAGEPPLPASLIAGAVTFYSLGAHAEERRAVVGAAVGLAGVWTAVIATDVDLQSFLFSTGLIVATPWLVGRSTRARALRRTLLEREQRQREQVAVGEERARIARELHDVTAHSVGIMVVHAQGARRILDRDPERAREALETIERTGQTALEEMRRALGVLRKPEADVPLAPEPGMDDLGALVEQARQGGLTVELVTEGTPAPLPADVDRSAYRIIQEALTNTRKHAGPVRARVSVRYVGEALELEISDDGVPGRVRNGVPGDGGHGLVGMRERVALYGGDLHADHRPEGGFVVRASLPLAP
ncbi:MAG TPA: sensor histidine kinase [Solirubrobacteraceae bacterium]|nr:sensor histidine kinase [Solirubrobacteraceae bacterium]